MPNVYVLSLSSRNTPHEQPSNNCVLTPEEATKTHQKTCMNSHATAKKTPSSAQQQQQVDNLSTTLCSLHQEKCLVLCQSPFQAKLLEHSVCMLDILDLGHGICIKPSIFFRGYPVPISTWLAERCYLSNISKWIVPNWLKLNQGFLAGLLHCVLSKASTSSQPPKQLRKALGADQVYP